MTQTSKLGIHLIPPYSAGARRIIAARPVIIKLLDLGDDMRAAIRDHKAAYPQGVTVLRPYTKHRYADTDDPVESAKHFHEEFIVPQLEKLTPDERPLLDYVEGPNECENTPCWESVDGAAWYGRFWEALGPHIANAGFKPCAASIPVGNPGGDKEVMEAKLEAFSNALYKMKELGGAWSYHPYTIHYTTDYDKEAPFSLRYRAFYDWMARNHPSLTDLPLLLTEGGVDDDGTPETSGWIARGTAEQYQSWLQWYDAELKKDNYVIGVTLFQIGHPSWPSFELEPIADWLAEYLEATLRAGIR